MNEYTLQEAQFLIAYYSDKVVGKSLDESGQAIIKNVRTEPCGGNKFWVRAYSHPLSGVASFFRDINEVAKQFNLETPTTVLEGLNPPR